VAECDTVITSSSLFPAFKSTLDQNLFKQKLKVYSVDDVGQSPITDLKSLLTDTSEPTPSSPVTFKGYLTRLVFNIVLSFR
jgi:hypothetical protein